MGKELWRRASETASTPLSSLPYPWNWESSRLFSKLLSINSAPPLQRVSHYGPGCTEESLYFYCNASAICRMGFWVLCIVAIQVNYPSASSPTETLLRLLLSLKNQVESSFRLHTSPRTSMNYPICSRAGSVSKEQGRMSRSLWMPWGTISVSSKPYPKGFQWVTQTFGNTTRHLILIEALINKWFVFFLYDCIDWQLVDWNIFVIPMHITVSVKNNYYCLGTNPPETEEPGPSGLFFFSALPLRCVWMIFLLV